MTRRSPLVRLGPARPLVQHPRPLPDGQPDPWPVLDFCGKDTDANWLSRRDPRPWAFGKVSGK
jgi:hypothetical protein